MEDPRQTPEQRRRNRRLAWILVLFVVALMVWTFVRANLWGISS